jgi:hypothetical protein
MKHTLALLAIAFSAYAQAAPASSTFHTLQTAWTAPAGSVPCSATVKTACVNGYTEVITPPAGVTGTNTVMALGSATTASWTPGGTLYCVVGHPVAVSSTTGADVGGAFYLRASVTSSGTVTVYLCGTGTPSSLAYNVTVF